MWCNGFIWLVRLWPKKCLCWPKSAASQRSKYTNIGMLSYDISNLKILMSKDSRGCKQSILKKWLTEALKKNAFRWPCSFPEDLGFSRTGIYIARKVEVPQCLVVPVKRKTNDLRIPPKTSAKKAFDYPSIGVMLHDPWRMPEKTDPWYWYLVILFPSATSWDVHNSCWDRLNSIKPGPGRLQFLRWASMRFLGPFVRFEDTHRTPRNRGHNGLAPTSSQPIGWSPPKTVVLNRESKFHLGLENPYWLEDSLW